MKLSLPNSGHFRVALRARRQFLALALLCGSLTGCQSTGELGAPGPAIVPSAIPGNETPGREAASATEDPELNPAVRLTSFQPDTQDESDELPISAESLPQPATDAADPLPIDHYVAQALSRHPRIRAARARVAAASARVPQAGALEDPVLSNGFWPIRDVSLQTADGRAVYELSVSQDYPWPAKRRVREAVACRELQMARANVAQVELEVAESARLAYYDLWLATRSIAIFERNREIATELIALAEARNAAGGSQQDVLRAQLQVDSLDDQLNRLHEQKALAQADLAAIIQQPRLSNIEPAEEIAVPGVQESLDRWLLAAEQCNPLLREKLWTVSRDRQRRELACLERYPDFMLGTGWMSMTENDAISPVATGDDSLRFMVGVSLPIWHQRLDASVREASAEVAASTYELADARNETFRQIRRLTEQATIAEQQLKLYTEQILPRAERALQLAVADYRGQQVDFGEVAGNFTEVLMFDLQAVRAQAALAQALARIERQVGCELTGSE